MSTSTAERTHQSHDHRHGEGCGHVSFAHSTGAGSHVDYVHDGHIHVEHDEHYDECGADGEHAAHDVHDHRHSPTCGHVGVPHDGHVDYVHDDHRHAAHDEHYDEH